MASTATTRLRLEKQGTGENNNSWGNKLNTTGLDLIDSAIAGMASYTLSAPKTLTSNNYAADEARMPFQNITGGTGGTITIPSAEGRYFFRNGSSGDVIITTGSGATATLASGDATAVHCDGTNVYNALTKSYVDAAIANAAFGGITLGSGMQTFLQTPTSANFFGTLTTKTGTAGTVVFSVSPALTGTPTAPTAIAGANTTQLATTEFVTAAVAATGSITASSTNTLTNKNISLANNTLAGTKAQFNTACSDGDFVYTADLVNGAGASGTWGIDISGAAASANALNTGNNYVVTRLRIGDGSVSTPSLGFNSDTDTGFYSGGANAINVSTGGVYRGGWDSSGNFYSSGQIVSAGDITSGGTITQTSDENLKTNWRPLPDDYVRRLSEVKSGIFDRTDRDSTQVGVGAQSLEKLLPVAVGRDWNGQRNVDYGGAALASAIELAKDNVSLRAEIDDLKRRFG